jgi:hypothetical protein
MFLYKMGNVTRITQESVTILKIVLSGTVTNKRNHTLPSWFLPSDHHLEWHLSPQQWSCHHGVTAGSPVQEHRPSPLLCIGSCPWAVQTGCSVAQTQWTAMAPVMHMILFLPTWMSHYLWAVPSGWHGAVMSATVIHRYSSISSIYQWPHTTHCVPFLHL